MKQAERSANKPQGGETEPTGKGTEVRGENEASVQAKPIVNDGKGGMESMDSMLNSDGNIYTEQVKSIRGITDDDFDMPSFNSPSDNGLEATLTFEDGTSVCL